MLKPMSAIVVIFAIALFIITCKQQERHEIKSPILVSKFARPLTDTTFASSPARLERGKYLANGVLRCFHCHAEVDKTKPGWPALEGMLGSGRIYHQTDSTRLVAPNISPDKETGAGKWTDDMFLRAIKDGIGHDGRALASMPWWTLRSMCDEDLASVIVYIRSIPPVVNKLPTRLLTVASEKEMQHEFRPMKDAAVSFPDTSTAFAKGKYLVTIGECEGCHTAWYKRNPGYFGGGNPIANDDTDSVIVSANISSGITGIGGWDDNTFIRIMRTGKAGSLHHSMPWIAFKNITDDDLKAMLLALKSMAPVEHRIVNGMKATLCEVCGEKHGYGDHNKAIPITAVAANTSLYPSYAGKYNDDQMFSVSIKLVNKKLWINAGIEGGKDEELIPVAANKFRSSSLPSPIHFIKDATGKVTGFTDEDLVPIIFNKSK